MTLSLLPDAMFTLQSRPTAYLDGPRKQKDEDEPDFLKAVFRELGYFTKCPLLLEPATTYSGGANTYIQLHHSNVVLDIAGDIPAGIPFPLPIIREDLNRILKNVNPSKNVLDILRHYPMHVEQLVADNPDRFCRHRIQERIQVVTENIARAKTEAQRMKQEQGLSDLLCALEEQEETVRHEIFLGCQDAAAALWIGDDHHLVARWDGPNTLSIVEVEKAYVKLLLTPTAFKSGRYHGHTFARILRYDRQAILDSTTFAAIRKIAGHRWEVKDSNGASVIVSGQWVRKDTGIYPSTISAALTKAQNGSRAFTRVFAGSSRTRMDDDKPLMKGIFQAAGAAGVLLPTIRYPNPLGGAMCLPSAFASGLYHLGYENLADQLWQMMQSLRKDENIVSHFRTMVNPVLKEKGLKLLKRRKPSEFYHPLKQECRTENLVLGQLRGRVGGINHVVAFVGDLVFDTNQKRALPITDESMDLVCGGAGFQKLYWSYEVVSRPCMPKK